MANVNSYSQLLDIAKSAYGSGLLEGSRGGNGYIGQYTDSDGQTHAVKVLTHRAERSAYAKAADGAGTEELAQATNRLKDSLISIAGGLETELGRQIKTMLEDAQTRAVTEHMTAGSGEAQVGLLSRKIVAQAVTTIAQAGTLKNALDQDVTFDWKDVNDTNRAATVADTKAKTVNTKLVRERTLVEVFSTEDKFEQLWHHPLKNSLRGDADGFGFDDFADCFRAMDSAYAGTNRSASCVPRLKELAANPNFGRWTIWQNLDELLLRLDDNLTAEEVLDQLREKLDVTPMAISRGPMVLRVLLEKIVLAEAKENPQPADVNLPNKEVQQKPSKQSEIPQEPPKLDDPPKSMDNLISPLEIMGCESLDELAVFAKDVFHAHQGGTAKQVLDLGGLRKTAAEKICQLVQDEIVQNVDAAIRERVLSALQAKISEFKLIGLKTLADFHVPQKEFRFEDLVKKVRDKLAAEIDGVRKNVEGVIAEEKKVMAKQAEEERRLEEARRKLPTAADLSACKTMDDLRKFAERVIGPRSNFNCSAQEFYDLRVKVVEALARLMILEYRDGLNEDDESNAPLIAKLGEMDFVQLFGKDKYGQMKANLSTDEKLVENFFDLAATEIEERIRDWSRAFKLLSNVEQPPEQAQVEQPAKQVQSEQVQAEQPTDGKLKLPTVADLDACQSKEDLREIWGKAFGSRSDFSCSAQEFYDLRVKVVDTLAKFMIKEYVDKLDKDDEDDAQLIEKFGNMTLAQLYGNEKYGQLKKAISTDEKLPEDSFDDSVSGLKHEIEKKAQKLVEAQRVIDSDDDE